ncbi:MAG: hypothetical protein QM617_04935 [Comamonas sp.]
MSRSTLALGLLLAVLAAAVGGYAYGLLQGRAKATAAQNAQTVQALQGLLTQHQDLTQRAGQASTALRTATAAWNGRVRQTTQELRDALAPTADSRAGCLFDAGVMRQLDAARASAGAAAASGIAGAVPATAATP